MSLMQLARVAAAEAQTISNSTTPSRSPTPPSPATSADEQLTTKRTMHSPLPSVRALFPTLLASPRAGPTAPASHSQFAAQSPGLTQVPNRPWHDPGQPSTSTASAAALASTRTPLQYAPNSYPHQRRERDEYRRPSPPQQHQHQHQHQPSANNSSCCCHCSHSHSSPHQPTSAATFTPAPAAAPSGPTYTVLAPSPSGLAPVQTDASRPIGIVRVGRDGRVSGSHASSSPSADEREQQQQQRFHPYSSGSGSPPRHQMMMNAQYSGHAPHQPAERDRYLYEAGSASVAQHLRQHQGYPQQLQQPQATFAQYMSAPTSTGNGGKKHVCEVCGAGFSRPSELKTHSHKHTGERPFTCGLCARNFSTSSNLGRHVRSIHPREREQAMRLARGPGGVSVLRDPTTTTSSIKEEQLGLLSPPESVSGSPLAAAARGFSSPTSSASELPTAQASRGAGGGALRLEIPVVVNKGHASMGSVSSMASSEMGSAGGIVSPEDVPMSAVEA